MTDRILLLKQLVSLDGLFSNITEVDLKNSAIVDNYIKNPIGIDNLNSITSEISELAEQGSTMSVRSYQLKKRVPAMLLLYKEVYRK